MIPQTSGVEHLLYYLLAVMGSIIAFLVGLLVTQLNNQAKKDARKFDVLFKYCDDNEHKIVECCTELARKIAELDATVRVCQAGEGKDLLSLSTSYNGLKSVLYETRDLLTRVIIQIGGLKEKK